MGNDIFFSLRAIVLWKLTFQIYPLPDGCILSIIDTTDVAANVNYPSDKKLIGNAFKKVIKEVEKFNEELASQQLAQFE
ncbi:MAG TPA: hypothetical protein VEG39_00755, partial [Clostridia bacterium]|nr:hypothetical protein [Clostridia bacterium]